MLWYGVLPSLLAFRSNSDDTDLIQHLSNIQTKFCVIVRGAGCWAAKLHHHNYIRHNCPTHLKEHKNWRHKRHKWKNIS